MMPGRKHLRGASAREQRQYEHILESAKEEGRYGKRAKEVAARTVMKRHGEEGHKPHRSSTTSSPGRKKSAAAASGSSTSASARKPAPASARRSPSPSKSKAPSSPSRSRK
jgi:hypothetical protein